MNRVILKTLYCMKTEDHSGADECKLEVFIDGELRGVHTRDLNNQNQDLWDINRMYDFANELVLKLCDLDSGKPINHDLLGNYCITASSETDSSLPFQSNGVHYELFYKIVRGVTKP